MLLILYQCLSGSQMAILSVNTQMEYQVGHLFRNARQELIETLGNTFLTYDQNKNLLPNEISGLLETRAYKEYLRRTLRTSDDIAFLQPGFFIAKKATPTSYMKIWSSEDEFIRDQRIGAIIYLTNVDDPIRRIIQSL